MKPGRSIIVTRWTMSWSWLRWHQVASVTWGKKMGNQGQWQSNRAMVIFGSIALPSACYAGRSATNTLEIQPSAPSRMMSVLIIRLYHALVFVVVSFATAVLQMPRTTKRRRLLPVHTVVEAIHFSEKSKFGPSAKNTVSPRTSKKYRLEDESRKRTK